MRSCPFREISQTPFIIFGALAFLGVPVVAYFGKQLNYSRTEYRFFADRLEFEEGFFSINKKVINFRNVKEVTLRKGTPSTHLRARHDLSRYIGDRLHAALQSICSFGIWQRIRQRDQCARCARSR